MKDISHASKARAAACLNVCSMAVKYPKQSVASTQSKLDIRFDVLLKVCAVSTANSRTPSSHTVQTPRYSFPGTATPPDKFVAVRNVL